MTPRDDRPGCHCGTIGTEWGLELNSPLSKVNWASSSVNFSLFDSTFTMGGYGIFDLNRYIWRLQL